MSLNIGIQSPKLMLSQAQTSLHLVLCGALLLAGVLPFLTEVDGELHLALTILFVDQGPTHIVLSFEALMID